MKIDSYYDGITIVKIENGVLVNSEIFGTKFFSDPQELLEDVLYRLYGKSRDGGVAGYGAVFVSSKPGEKFESPPEVEPA